MPDTYTYNETSLFKNGKPWFPVMGEFHFSRYAPELWEEELRKMKAGGVEVVATYVFWIHHEEIRGQFDFTGCRDLRHFLLLTQKVGLKVWLWLGPWAHGEVRNGGFPDWLVALEAKFTLRSNAPRYLALVRLYWRQVALQSRSMMLREGGPVIGIQIENEYGHAGGFTGKEGEAHMRTLTAMAKELGFIAPYYTATGWGGACTGGLLPVMGGYCEAPWSREKGELPANTNYVFSHIRNDALIACDHEVDDTATFDERDFPYLTAELGGGMQVTKHRRPVASGTDIGAMSLAKLGSGVNLLGYYMYHGGSNPKGELSTLQESTATGYPNDLPEINYDFNAPLRQFGTISDTYREVRLLAQFVRDFGSELALLPADISPAGVCPDNTETLRLAARHDAAHGYVFYNNYQRRYTMAAHLGVTLCGPCEAPVTFPAIDIAPGEYGFFPYNMPLGNAVLQSALATPICRLADGEDENNATYVFYGDRAPQFAWQGGARANVLHLPRAEALNATKLTFDRDYLIITEDFAYEDSGRLVVDGGETTVLKSYPALPADMLPFGFTAVGHEGEQDEINVYLRQIAAAPAKVELTPVATGDDTVAYTICLDYQGPNAPRTHGHDWLLELDFAGDSMELYAGDEKLNDYYYTGQTALLSLGYFNFPQELKAVVHPLYQADVDAQNIFLETVPAMQDGRVCCIDGATLTERFRTTG